MSQERKNDDLTILGKVLGALFAWFITKNIFWAIIGACLGWWYFLLCLIFGNITSDTIVNFVNYYLP